jgi:hypothetical protein
MAHQMHLFTMYFIFSTTMKSSNPWSMATTFETIPHRMLKATGMNKSKNTHAWSFAKHQNEANLPQDSPHRLIPEAIIQEKTMMLSSQVDWHHELEAFPTLL